jgi:hypothetical protein
MAQPFDSLGEWVTYYAYGGSLKTFKALVERKPSQVQSAGGYAYAANVLDVFLPRDAAAGVLAVRERMDKMRFKRNLSDAQDTEWTVTKVMGEDAGIAGLGGMYHIQVQA